MFAIVISWFFGLVTSSCQDNMLYISCEDNVVVLTFFYMRQNAPTSCKLTTGVNNVALPTVNNVCAAHCEHCCQQSCLAMKTMCRLQKHSLVIVYRNQWSNWFSYHHHPYRPNCFNQFGRFRIRSFIFAMFSSSHAWLLFSYSRSYLKHCLNKYLFLKSASIFSPVPTTVKKIRTHSVHVSTATDVDT